MNGAVFMLVFCIVGMFLFSYLGDRSQGKSKKRSYIGARRHVERQGPGLVIYILAVFFIIAVFSALFG